MSEQSSHTEKEIREAAPTLFSIEKKEVEVLADYFDTLADRTLDKISERQSGTKIISLTSFSAKWLAAASVLLLLAMGYFSLKEDGNTTNDLASIELDLDLDEELFLSIEESLIIDEYVLTIEDTESDPRIDYLMENDFELDDLIEEL